MCSAIRGMSEGVASDLCTSVELLSEPKKHSQDSTLLSGAFTCL